MDSDSKQSNLLSVTGLWINKSKDGKSTFLAGNLSPRVRVLVFKNSRKQKDTDPDYNVCFAPVEQKEKVEREPDVDDIPF